MGAVSGPELLRFTTAGSVDDGKSTLIGRLLYDSRGVYEDQLDSAKKASRNGGGGAIDLSLLTDGLRAEREQGITIDVAYRYFSTPRRKFIIADTPGHEQYTRNMATGASTADLAVILLDARQGVLPQSRRHACIAWLLGIRQIVVAVNKMDLVDYSREVFERIRNEFTAFATRLEGAALHFIPVSALKGDNVVRRSSRMPWFEGESLLEYLEMAPVAGSRSLGKLRFPVQYVARPAADFRGYAGQVAAGVIRPGDAVLVLPSGRTSRVKSLPSYDGELAEACPPMSITVCLEDEIDVSRGDMLVDPAHPPRVSRRFEATVVWMSEQPLEPGRPYLIKHTTRQVRATVAAVRRKIDVHTLGALEAERLELNDIGTVIFEAHRPLFFDPYGENRATGSFILIDPLTNATAGAGMIQDAAAGAGGTRGPVTAADRRARFGHQAATVWLPARPALARLLERMLFDHGCNVHVLSGPALLAETALALSGAGLITVCAAAREDVGRREAIRTALGAEQFVEIDVPRLPPSDEEAAAGICQLLEQRGVIQGFEPFCAGGGI